MRSLERRLFADDNDDEGAGDEKPRFEIELGKQRGDKLSVRRKKPLLFSSARCVSREELGVKESSGTATVSVAVQCTSGHEVVQQVRPTGEPDETTSGPGRSPCPRFSSLFHSTLIEKRPYTLDLTKTRTPSLSMFTRASFVARGSCGEGMTMVLDGYSSRRNQGGKARDLHLTATFAFTCLLFSASGEGGKR
ncbi:hypothetical protein G5I_06864 [Acromyrmex echinatior]|uniref:Uncharacterized protein n=1 Tax=Acromyrmex echinatior TaxID=103372 RepID=F4WM31_ACREC|nr:hypothetical protein G5I_06864 [Acromyrmex echinatior]